MFSEDSVVDKLERDEMLQSAFEDLPQERNHHGTTKITKNASMYVVNNIKADLTSHIGQGKIWFDLSTLQARTWQAGEGGGKAAGN